MAAKKALTADERAINKLRLKHRFELNRATVGPLEMAGGVGPGGVPQIIYVPDCLWKESAFELTVNAIDDAFKAGQQSVKRRRGL